MKYVISGAAAALLLAAGVCGAAMAQTAPAAPSSTPAAGAAPTQQAKADPGDKVICHYEDGDTGSLLNSRHKVCHTKREWDQINRDARALVDNHVDQAQRPR